MLTMGVVRQWDDPEDLPVFAPLLGVADPVARWSAAYLMGGADSPVNAWQSIVSTHVLTGSATLKIEEAGQYLRFNGTNQQLSISGLTGVRTVGVLYRKPDGVSGGAVTAGASYFTGNPPNGFNIIGGTAQYPTPARRAHLWAWRFLSFDGTTRRWATGGEADTSTAQATASIPNLDLGRYNGATYGQCDIAEVALFATALTQADRQAITANWAARQPSWAA